MAEYEHLRATRAVEQRDESRPSAPRPTPLSARIARERARSRRVHDGAGSPALPPAPATPPPGPDPVRVAHEVAAQVRTAEPEEGRLARLGGRLRGRRSS